MFSKVLTSWITGDHAITPNVKTTFVLCSGNGVPKVSPSFWFVMILLAQLRHFDRDSQAMISKLE